MKNKVSLRHFTPPQAVFRLKTGVRLPLKSLLLCASLQRVQHIVQAAPRTRSSVLCLTPSVIALSCVNSPQSPASQFSQSDSFQALVAATGNGGNMSTSCTAQVSPSATTTFSSFAFIVTIDDPGTLCVTVPDTAAPTVAPRDKTHWVDDDNESQPRLVRDFEQGELHHLVKVKQKVMYYRRL